MWIKRVPALATAALIGVALLGGAVPAAASTPPSVTLEPGMRAHPMLQYGAQAEPDKKVRVVVQLTLVPGDAREFARSVGGNFVEAFPFINAIVLDIPFRDIPGLAALPSVRYVSPDGTTRRKSIDDSDLQTTFDAAADVPAVWNNTAGLSATGEGVTVAVLDTGVNTDLPDFRRCPSGYSGDVKQCPSVVTTIRVHDHVDNSNNQHVKDGDGHGTHVAGIIDGRSPDGRYVGVAPDANILSLAIADDSGAAQETDLLRGLQWVYDHRVERTIRAVNISMAASVPTSYTTSPVDAAVEQLWRGGVVVVTSAGNKGSEADATWYAPGNDPLVITVGALDTNQTAAFGDDTLAFFSSRGFTQDGVYKPDLVAPGRRIVSVLSHPDAVISKALPDHVTPDRRYIRLSGTSMAAPMVTGAAALIFERFPALNPDQLKGLLTGSARRYSGQSDDAGALDVSRAMQSAATGAFTPANRAGLPLAMGSMPSGAPSGDLSMTSAYWNSAYWNSAYWNSAYWNSAYWNSAYWNSAYWNSAYWNAVDTED